MHVDGDPRKDPFRMLEPNDAQCSIVVQPDNFNGRTRPFNGHPQSTILQDSTTYDFSGPNQEQQQEEVL